MAPAQYSDQPGSLLEKTRALLEKDSRSLYQIAVATGVPFYWLRKFKAGDIKAPSVNRTQHLYEKLSGSKIAV